MPSSKNVCRKHYHRRYYQRHALDVMDKGARHRARVKRDVLTFYGRNGIAQCTWAGCNETDIDVLTLDHIHDNGREDRDRHGKRHLCGSKLYAYLRYSGYPDGYQTLCANHQLLGVLLVWIFVTGLLVGYVSKAWRTPLLLRLHRPWPHRACPRASKMRRLLEYERLMLGLLVIGALLLLGLGLYGILVEMWRS